MMNSFSTIKDNLRTNPKRWLVTGVAGFIGSNILETLLRLDQVVVGLDNFATGHQHNLDDVQRALSTEQWRRFTFIDGDICDLQTCRKTCNGIGLVLHQAALGSVPRSIEDPILTNASNVTGFLNMLTAARETGVKRFVYAASSSTYGDHPDLPKQEDKIGNPLSPYAVTKLVNELYADVFARVYGFKTIGLRYFNVFGPRQDPNGAYAAVIPKWFLGMLAGKEISIYGDGETSRDFCYIDNCVQANILAACTEDENALNQVYNVACGERTSLNGLFGMIRDRVSAYIPGRNIEPVHKDFRPGDVRHSLADIGKANRFLGYSPEHSVMQGLDKTAKWYIKHLAMPAG